MTILRTVRGRCLSGIIPACGFLALLAHEILVLMGKSGVI